MHSRTDPFAQALLVADGQIAWLGAEESIRNLVDQADEVVDLDGALVTPAFVDAHVHLLETGLALEGVDLSPSAGVRSLATALDAVALAAREARAAGANGPLLGHGWDETGWPEGRPPTREELDVATGGAPVYLARADVHSAVVSSSFARVSGCIDAPGWDDSGLVTGEAHHRARTSAREVSPERRGALHRAALEAAARAGIVSVHEMSGPFLDTREGLAGLLDLTRDASSGLPLVVGFRAELCETTDDARLLLEAIPGLAGIGGDLSVDGSLGSRTAALRHPYADGPGTGDLKIAAEQVANHVASVTRAGSRAAFHVIGDRAMDEVLLGFRAAVEVEGVAAVRAAGHRIEHAEMIDATALATMLLLGLTASVQPAFDAQWGGPAGMYAARLGAGRAAGLNPIADLAGAGVPLALGSDSPVTPFNPWGAVRAAIEHHEPSQRVSARAAFRAHTRGGWRSVGMDGTGAGEIRLGAPASLAVWKVASLAVQAPEGRLSAWSTDARAGTPLLPELGSELPEPTCLRTVRDGVVLYDALG
ncbi:MAG: amidohydrolase family protein [Cellulomonadaceae bacterium]|nr:amidohydrolase family protein [Cellulomonadaceae bacterium]